MKARGELCVGIALLAWAGVVAGDTHYVASGQSIQAVIDDPTVAGGDVIEVAPGTYTGPGRTETVPALVSFKGKAIRLRSSGGPAVTTIDGTGYYHVVQCVSGEGADTVLEGFTITGGNADDLGGPEPPVHAGGGGMFNRDSSPTVRNCIFQGNSAGTFGGGGMFNDGGSPIVRDCTFNSNVANPFGACGGGMHDRSGSATVTDCTFSGNSAGGGGGGLCGGSVVTNCTFSENGAEVAGGIDNAGVVTNCTFNSNNAIQGGGGIGRAGAVANCVFVNNFSLFGAGGIRSDGVVVNCAFLNNDSLDVGAVEGAGTVTNCIVWWDKAPMARVQIGGSCVVTYSDVKGGFPGAGNLDADPLFVGSEDLHLSTGSPCIDAGTNTPPGGLPATDLDGNPRSLDGNGDGAAVADMGAYEAPQVNREQLVRDLLQDVLDLNLEPPVQAGLTAQLRAALRLVSNGNARNDAGAVGALNGFIKTVTAYRGKKIAEADADALIASARQIINLLSGT
jgi:hypothetical protein